MDASSNLLSDMMRIHDQYGRSVLALQEVPHEEIRRYGSVKPERVGDNLVQILDLVEKPEPAAAPSNLAVMGRYIFTPEIFDKLEKVQPGVGGEIQLTDAIAMLIADQAVYGVTFDGGRYDTGTVPAYLETIVELALDRPDLGPHFGRFLADLCARRGLS
jgi:UTP--glucose-1-phosphate uridylyltransferase